MFSVLPTALRIAIRRLNGNRRLMAAVAIGVILAVALMSSTVIYRDALRQLGLQTDLSRVSDQETRCARAELRARRRSRVGR